MILNSLAIKPTRLLPSYCSQGIIIEALPLICTYAFLQLDIHRIEGFVESESFSSKNTFK
ncbi:MAG: GNAT family N-acetyltransferase [Bacteroidetes bacterium]|nr:GNAT family N-acetyltransferase [Bacteroidota bacterium]